MTFNGHRLIKNHIYIPKKSNKFNISYTLTPWLRNLNTDFTLNNCLIESVKLIKNADPDKYKYSSCSIEFDIHSEFSLPDGGVGRNATIFGVDVS